VEKEKSENARLNDLKTQLAGLMETKRRSILERQDELRQVRDAASEISKSVSDLNELITKLGKTVQDNTGLGAYDAEVRAAPATDSNGAPGATTTPGSAGTDVVVMAPVENAAILSNPGRIKPAIPFQLAKGKLPLPVSGKRVLNYGERTQYGSQSKGLVMETRSAAQVTSPCDGWILYAGEFRSYGKLLIIDAGGGYNVVLAGLSQIDVRPGEFVLAAEPVGTMMAVKKEPAGAPSAAPVLYIEFRKDKQPIDPDPWWVTVSQKAQG
jgi:septal ring factor EnvC (AmiA/AmiB activator)